MARPADPAEPGRIRRLVLTAAPPLLIVAVPLLVLSLYGGRLPDHAYVKGWDDPSAYPSRWNGWTVNLIFSLVYFEVFSIGLFLRYWRWPELQRWLVTFSFACGVFVPLSGALETFMLFDATGPVPVPTGLIVAELALAALAGLLGRLLAGPLPAPPEASAVPPPQAPALALTPESRAMFAVSTWSWRRLWRGMGFLVLAVFLVSVGSDAWQGPVLVGLIALFEMLQVRTRLQIDGTGVGVTLPWLGGLRRTVPYTVVRFAEVRSDASNARLGLIGGARGWGYVNGHGPVLALKLTDGREFLYSTRDAETAAALVNGSLHRARQGAASADRG